MTQKKPMAKTTRVTMSEGTYQALATRALEDGTSVAALIRRAVEVFVCARGVIHPLSEGNVNQGKDSDCLGAEDTTAKVFLP
jgi:hypothetical protein